MSDNVVNLPEFERFLDEYVISKGCYISKHSFLTIAILKEYLNAYHLFLFNYIGIIKNLKNKPKDLKDVTGNLFERMRRHLYGKYGMVVYKGGRKEGKIFGFEPDAVSDELSFIEEDKGHYIDRTMLLGRLGGYIPYAVECHENDIEPYDFDIVSPIRSCNPIEILDRSLKPYPSEITKVIRSKVKFFMYSNDKRKRTLWTTPGPFPYDFSDEELQKMVDNFNKKVSRKKFLEGGAGEHLL